MSKHKSKEQWIKLFKKYESGNWDWEVYYQNEVSFGKWISKGTGQARNWSYKLKSARSRFRKKYKQWKLLDNWFMEKAIETRGAKKKYDIEEVISNLTEKEKHDMLKRYLEITKKKDKKKEALRYDWSHSRRAYIFGLHRTTFYKKSKKRTYKYEKFIKDIIFRFHINKSRYGSMRLSQELMKKGINISDRTLRNYMSRLGLKTITRVAKRPGEKKYKVYVPDLVNRDYHGKYNDIKATDVSYIPANEEGNHVYLSATIDHKTKYVHWSISKDNDLKLVMDTQKQVKDTDYILHSDHAWQYFQKELLDFNKQRNIRTSMKATSDPLDNREIEYFFGCLKTESLHHIKTHRMKFDEIKEHVKEYVDWYNTKRIQKRLQWKTPAEASAYVV